MGYVTQIIVQHEGVVFFQTDAMASTAWPSCAVTQRYAINLADPGGPSLYSAVLTAQKAHSQISISGKGTCDIWADSESVEYVAVNP